MASSNLVQVSVQVNTEVLVLGPNVKRKRVMITWTSPTVGYIRFNAAGNVAGGLSLSSGNGPLTFSEAEMGDRIKGDWYFFSGAAAILGVLETMD